MNALNIQKFFVRPSWPLILFTTLTILVAVLSLRAAIMYADWQRELKEFPAREAERVEFCEAMRKACERDKSNDVRRGTEFERMDIEWCVERAIFSSLFFSATEKTCRKIILPPPDFHIEEVVISPVAFYPLLVPYLFFVMRLFYSVEPLGWRRIAIMLAVVFFVMVSYQFIQNQWGFGEYLSDFIAFVFLPVTASLAVPSLALCAHRWIADGFPDTNAQQRVVGIRTPKDADGFPGPVRLSWRSMLSVLRWTGLLALFIAALYFQPEKTLVASASGMLVAALIGAIVTCRRRFSKKNG